MNTKNVLIAAKNLADKYADDINTDLLNELEHLKTIHVANLGQKTLSPFDLLNRLHTLKIDTLFQTLSLCYVSSAHFWLPLLKQKDISAHCPELKMF